MWNNTITNRSFAFDCRYKISINQNSLHGIKSGTDTSLKNTVTKKCENVWVEGKASRMRLTVHVVAAQHDSGWTQGNNHTLCGGNEFIISLDYSREAVFNGCWSVRVELKDHCKLHCRSVVGQWLESQSGSRPTDSLGCFISMCWCLWNCVHPSCTLLTSYLRTLSLSTKWKILKDTICIQDCNLLPCTLVFLPCMQHFSLRHLVLWFTQQ